MPKYPNTSFLAMQELLKYYSYNNAIFEPVQEAAPVNTPGFFGKLAAMFLKDTLVSSERELQQLFELFLDMSNGGMFTYDFAQFLSAYKGSSSNEEDLGRLVTVYFEPEAASGVELGSVQPSYDDHGMSVIMPGVGYINNVAPGVHLGNMMDSGREDTSSPLSLNRSLLSVFFQPSVRDIDLWADHIMILSERVRELGNQQIIEGLRLRVRLPEGRGFITSGHRGLGEGITPADEVYASVIFVDNDVNTSRGATASGLVGVTMQQIEDFGTSAELTDEDKISIGCDVLSGLADGIERMHGLPSNYSNQIQDISETFTINGDPENPNSQSAPGLSVIVMPNIAFSPAMRHVGQAALFCSGPPTTEMSLCAPYLNLSFIVNTPPVDSNGNTRGNLISFLNNGKINVQHVDYEMINSLPDDFDSSISLKIPGLTRTTRSGIFGDEEEEDLNTSSISRAGMEVFTSPQTLVNMDINKETSGRRILDPTQPFMSLDSVTVKEYQSGYGLIGFKKATVDFTLHDRSRLAEVSHFIAPASFGNVSAILEFGWSHPNSDPAIGSPWGIFLNSLRNTSKYRLIKGNYNMDSSGQIKITLEMAATGGEDSKTTHACTGSYVHTTLVNSLIREIRTMLLRQISSEFGVTEEIRDIQYVSSEDSGGTGTLITRGVYDSLRGLKQKLLSGAQCGRSVSDAIGQIQNAVENIEGHERGASIVPKRSVASQMASILDNLNPGVRGGDDYFIRDLPIGNTSVIEPDVTWRNSLLFASLAARPTDGNGGSGYGINDPQPVDEDGNEVPQEREYTGPGTGDWVSLGKVVTRLIGAPLASTGRYDEVQIFFYSFNECAGALAGEPVAYFPIRFSNLLNQITDAIRRNPNISTNKIQRFVSQHVGNGAHQAYGFLDLHQRNAEIQEIVEQQAESGSGTTSQVDSLRSSFNIRDEVSRRMYELGLVVPKFKIPRLKFVFESVPALTFPDGINGSSKKDRSKTILRIHVSDSNASAHPGNQLILDSLTAGSVPAIFNQRNESFGGRGGIVEALASAREAVNDDGDRVVREQTNRSSAGNPSDSLSFLAAAMERDSVHEYIKSKLPTVQFGTAFSPFKDVSISGMSSGALFDALLSETFRDRSDPQTDQGSNTGLEEVTVVPVTAKAVGLGNPMFHYGQQFYLDLKTGTTADNIFTVRDVTHTLGPGSFETAVSFYPAGANATVESIRANMISTLVDLNDLSKTTTWGGSGVEIADTPTEGQTEPTQSRWQAFRNR